MIDSNRGLGQYIVLSIITCGIYSWYFLYKLAADVNIMCKDDGDKTAGLATFILLSIITCGIYPLIWYYKIGNRLMANAPKYSLNFTENGTSVLMWMIFGSLLCGIGYFIGINILIKNTNAMANAYNAKVRV